MDVYVFFFFFFQAEDGIRDVAVTGVQTCALPIYPPAGEPEARRALEQARVRVRLRDAAAQAAGVHGRERRADRDPLSRLAEGRMARRRLDVSPLAPMLTC